MSKFLYPIYNLPNEYKQDLDVRELPLYLKWWLYNHYKVNHGALSDILIGTHFTLTDTLKRKFKIFEIQGNSVQGENPSPENKQDIHNVIGDVEVVIGNTNILALTNNYITRDQVTYSNIQITDNSIAYSSSGNRAGYLGYVIPITIGQTYTISFGELLSGSKIYTIQLDEKPTTITAFGTETSTGTSITATKNYLGVWLTKIGNTDAKVTNLMVEPGTTASSYVTHEEQTYAFTLSQGQKMYKGDYLSDDGIHHVRGEYALQGEDIARLNTQGENYISVIVNKFAEILNKESAINILCNMLKASSSTIVNSLRIVTTSGNIVLIFSTDFAEYNITAVRTKIQNLYDNGTPLVIEIPFSEEVIEPYTEEQQEQYNLIKKAKAKAYQDVTIITGKSDDADPNIKIQYFKKETENTSPLGLSVSPITDTNFVENDEEIMQVEDLNTESEDFEESEEIEDNETDT